MGRPTDAPQPNRGGAPLLAYVVRGGVSFPSIKSAAPAPEPRENDLVKVHPTGQKATKCPQVEGHMVQLRRRHAKLRREGYRKSGGDSDGLEALVLGPDVWAPMQR